MKLPILERLKVEIVKVVQILRVESPSRKFCFELFQPPFVEQEFEPNPKQNFQKEKFQTRRGELFDLEFSFIGEKVAKFEFGFFFLGIAQVLILKKF